MMEDANPDIDIVYFGVKESYKHRRSQYKKNNLFRIQFKTEKAAVKFINDNYSTNHERLY